MTAVAAAAEAAGPRAPSWTGRPRPAPASDGCTCMAVGGMGESSGALYSPYNYQWWGTGKSSQRADQECFEVGVPAQQDGEQERALRGQTRSVLFILNQ